MKASFARANQAKKGGQIMKYIAIITLAAFTLALGACAKKDDTSSTYQQSSSTGSYSK